MIAAQFQHLGIDEPLHQAEDVGVGAALDLAYEPLFAEGNGFEISVPRCRATANSVGAFISADEWRLLEPPKLLYRFAEADDRSGDSPEPTVGRPQPDRSLETAAYLARN